MDTLRPIYRTQTSSDFDGADYIPLYQTTSTDYNGEYVPVYRTNTDAQPLLNDTNETNDFVINDMVVNDNDATKSSCTTRHKIGYSLFALLVTLFIGTTIFYIIVKINK